TRDAGRRLRAAGRNARTRAHQSIRRRREKTSLMRRRASPAVVLTLRNARLVPGADPASGGSDLKLLDLTDIEGVVDQFEACVPAMAAGRKQIALDRRYRFRRRMAGIVNEPVDAGFRDHVTRSVG